ncbi:Hpt domain-containing protein [Mucilaginibacter ginsenosidivorans]|uniref:Hpt domain-containing protein n=1 Tax=Mucilaginibacter ginsenosidivorans TaxID=398053 RepID=A0A5B8V0V6_9SPHI|nr:Hpt domain-containing protein [Mucilaginibacter ginsenosidivorans]QEC64839.1 Hpt domain-containing protein [Mucilaginibacter ginsenosidivorans]
MSQDLDLSFLYEIADGSNEFIIESIDMLLQQAPELLGNIDTALKAQDWAAAAAAAHKLKPSMGFFGMLVSQELLQEIEMMCKAGASEPETIAAKFARVSDLISVNVVELNRVKAEKEAEL